MIQGGSQKGNAPLENPPEFQRIESGEETGPILFHSGRTSYRQGGRVEWSGVERAYGAARSAARCSRDAEKVDLDLQLQERNKGIS